MADRYGTSSRARRPDGRNPASVHHVVPIVTALAILLAGAGGATAWARTADLADVIVRELPRHHVEAVRSVERLGGDAGRRLLLIDGFESRLPPQAMAALQRAAGVVSVTPTAELRLSGSSDAGATSTTPSITDVAEAIGATALWKNHLTG